MPVLNRRGMLAAALGAAAAGCAPVRLAGERPLRGKQAYGFGALEPLDLSPGNLVKITVCTRPVRPAGPRLEAQALGGKRIVHNYGHGGSGWSLAWGYAEAARALVLRDRPKSAAVLGAGAIGLTTAIALAEAGIAVTIHARDLPMQSRSARATGVWSPSSRIALSGAADPGFPARWEALTRRSYRRHLGYVGRSGHPVEFTPRFFVGTKAPEAPLAVPPPGAGGFLHLERRVRGMTPPWTERHDMPFPVDGSVRGGLVMTFNITEYARQMTDDFLALGGRIEQAEIASLEELARLPADVVVNCAGYDAKELARDDTLVPVRGQIAWMAPQTDRLYGTFHRNVMVLSRRDGLLIQETGGNDFYGYGDDGEAEDREEVLAALAKAAPLFAYG
ncbi:NAD(P)/FAD-dependent oxidoreductase [Parvularcula oceani]|uniref:NAD(P)/FAD-dependent oxidoreductase n=1 Tax=Parvularcula oceani TaxID=1247963 RepID=UPI000AEFC7B8|nr:FAD-dependent oxidoreductase [Parvularcula oceani]